MSVKYKDYYKILGVSRTASQEEISRAFKKLARAHHPDLNQGDKKSEELFKEINEANEVLKDPEKRKLYDHLGADWQHGQQFQRPGRENVRYSSGDSGFSDFFETIFGGGQGSRFSGGFSGFGGGFGGFTLKEQRGRNVEAVLALSLEEAFAGGRKTFTLQSSHGDRSLEVLIPAGVKNGTRIRLAEQGDPSPAGPAGDLFLKISLHPHRLFTVDDADVVYNLRLAPWEAALGVKVRVPTLSGEVDLSIKPGADSGKKLRLRGKGLGSGSQKGDQIIRVTVVVPEASTAEEKALWEKLRDISSFQPRG
jgi:curved DNA-binding protein